MFGSSRRPNPGSDLGLFDFFSGGRSGDGALKKHAPRIADKRAQAPDRWDSIVAVGKVIADCRRSNDAEAPALARRAVEALLPRYGFYVDPSITDQDEKDEVARHVVAAGESAIDPVIAMLRRSDSLGWPLKLLERLVPGERVVGELLELLAAMDTEYARDPTRKHQVLQTLEDRKDPRIVAAVVRFLEDVNETARFHAIGAVLEQENAEEGRDAMVASFPKDDSVRCRARIVEGFALRGWRLGAAPDRAKLEKLVPSGYNLDKDCVPKKS